MSLSLTLDGQPVVGYSNLQTKAVARGGFASVSFNMNRRLDKSLLATFTDCLVYDTATGEQVGGGRLMEQGRNDDGTWGITCLGEGLASLQDRKTPYALIDQALDNFYLKERSSKRQSASVTQYPGQSDDDPVLVWEAQEGLGIHTGASVVMLNRVAELCDMQIGTVGFRHKSGIDNGDMLVQVYVGKSDDPEALQIYSGGFAVAMSSRQVRARGGSITGDRTSVAVRWYTAVGFVGHDGDTVYVTEDFWSAVRDIIIRFQPYNADGTLKTSGMTAEYVKIEEAFTDWCVRYSPRLDIANASLDAGTYQFDQLCWIDGIHGMDMMDYLIESEPAFTWAVWEKQSNGKWKTELRSLPSSVRYEASVDDGFSAPSPTTDIFDTVTVTGKSPGGRDLNVTRTQVVPDLAAAGIPREDTIPLGSEQWSTGNANRAGDTYLASHAVAPNAGTLTVARPILDNTTGRWVKPHNIRPGELIRVRGVQPTPDTLNATSPDGVTVFRIVSVTYDDDSGQATLELDVYTLDEKRAIARLARARTRR